MAAGLRASGRSIPVRPQPSIVVLTVQFSVKLLAFVCRPIAPRTAQRLYLYLILQVFGVENSVLGYLKQPWLQDGTVVPVF